jgi:ubiquinol-cytochrome c reductase iron-sulfur subunit
MAEQGVNRTRRRLLVVTSGLGVIGAGFAAVPFITSMTPSARARAMGAPVEADISKLEPGQRLVVEWRGKPVWIVRRTDRMLATLPRVDDELADPDSENSDQPKYAKNEARSIRPEILVLIGICTHLGCSPLAKLEPGAGSGLGTEWLGGFFCPCHGSLFDLAGRVYKNVPAPTNLVVPPHKYLSDTRILIGVDSEGVA